MIKAVVFDIDNTLVDRRKAFLKMCDYIIDKYSPIYPYKIPREKLIAAMVEIDGNGYGGLRSFIPRLQEYWRLPLTLKDYITDRNEVFGKLSVPMPDLYEVLDELKKRYKLGVITNGFSEVQRDKIEAVGITSYFDDIIVSGEVPFEKPDPGIFLLSCKNLGVKPDEMVYVGDYYPNDIAGALNAKIKPIWIISEADEQYEQYETYDGIRINKLTDLLKLL